MTSVSPVSRRSSSPPRPASPEDRKDFVVSANGVNGAGAQQPQQQQQQQQLRPPPARPPLRNNFDLEPNPFEQSFSSSAVSIKTLASEQIDSDRASLHGHDAAMDASNGKGADDKPILPPLASIVSPSDSASYSGWGMGSSLRSGPLSPAMLTGPASQPSLGLGAFDNSFVRTGLTPDVPRTGFTPLIAGATSFPPPTPNTAALLAIVNGTSASQPLSSTAAITPGTLSALHGVLNSSLAVAGPTAMVLDAQQPHGNPNFADRRDPNGRPNGPFTSFHPDAYSQDPNTHDMTNAASALYLLSQSQQNLRPSQGQIAPSALSDHPTIAAAAAAAQQADDREDTPKRATKRKSMDTPAPPATRGGKKAKSAVTATASNANNNPLSAAATRTPARRRSTRSGGDMDDMDDDDDDEDDDDTYGEMNMSMAAMNSRAQAAGSGKPGQKKFETEEDKRRNFLERNRQAALKCRQRKKKWLQDLQAKVEFLSSENERLTTALISSREEIARLSQLVVAHGGAPPTLPPSVTDISPPGGHAHSLSSGQPVSVSVSVPTVGKTLSAAVPLPSSIGHPSQQGPPPMQAGITVGRGYGY